MTDLANKIKEKAKENGKTITGIANELGVMQQALSRTINNPRITLEDLEKIAGVIGCNVADFLNTQTNTITCPYCGKKIVFNKEEEE